MEADLQKMVEAWWRDKAQSSGGTISSEVAGTLATEIAKIIDLSAEECLEVARTVISISDQPISQPEGPKQDPQPEPEPEGETEKMAVRNPDVDLTTVDFVMKYWMECGDGRPKLLLEKALSVGRDDATIAGINSAKQVLRKRGWKPGEPAEAPAPAPPAPATTGGKRGPKNPIDTKIASIEALIAEHEKAIEALRKDITALQRAREIMAS